MSHNYRTVRLALLACLAIGLLMLTAAIPTQAADTEWHARYWNNRKLEGEPVLQRFETDINYDWGGGFPAPGINADEFSAKWTRDVEFPAGTYRFIATTDDGMRVWVDEVLLIDSWNDSQVHTVSADRYLSPGDHTIRVEYYEAGGDAVARFSWVLLSGPPATFVNWKGEYFNNANLQGPPLFVRDDAEIDFDWGLNAPIAGFGTDDFSVRWTRTLNLAPGRYRFSVVTDDGVRVWVNNDLVIDEWREQASAAFSADLTVPGLVPVKVEYFDGRDKAVIDLDWAPIAGTAAGIVPAPTPPATTEPTGLTATMTGALYLNVREAPELESEVIGHLRLGQTVVMTGYRSIGSYWIEIFLSEGETGWVSTRYMTTGVPVSDLPVKP